jgi:hypothetical protein
VLSCKQLAQLLESVQHVRSVKLYVAAGKCAARAVCQTVRSCWASGSCRAGGAASHAGECS